jgi:hypothetical protein
LGKKKQDKSDAEIQQDKTKFVPTPKQIAFVEALVNPDVPASIAKTCEAAGVSRDAYYRWVRNDDGFLEWKEKYRTQLMIHIGIAYLDKIGLAAARKNFPYWMALQRKFGGMVGEVEGGLEKAGQALGTMWECLQNSYEEDKGQE